MRKIFLSGGAFAFFLLGLTAAAQAMPGALAPSTAIDVSAGAGVGSGHADTGPAVFDFFAAAGDVLRLDVDVTAVYPGVEYTDDDSMLFVFDADGHLLAENDDEDEELYQSLITAFLIPDDGRYYAAVTTYSNRPVMATGRIAGWTGGGGSSIDFDLRISAVTPSTTAPEPGTWLLLSAGLAGLAGRGGRRRLG